jgi:hypothetical protein
MGSPGTVSDAESHEDCRIILTGPRAPVNFEGGAAGEESRAFATHSR